MKRRGLIKTSVGAAGLALSTPHSLLGRFETQEPRTLYDKIWDEHVVANLGGSADLLHFDRMIIRDSGPELVHRLLEEGLTIPSPELILATPGYSEDNLGAYTGSIYESLAQRPGESDGLRGIYRGM